MRAAIVAHHVSLNGRLPGMIAGIDHNHSATGLEHSGRGPQEIGCNRIVQVVKNSDGHCDIGQFDFMTGKVAHVIADELSTAAVASSRMVDAGLVMIEADIGCLWGQTMEQCSRAATDVDDAIIAARPDDIIRKSPKPTPRADQMMK
jgi:hypothetical protein